MQKRLVATLGILVLTGAGCSRPEAPKPPAPIAQATSHFPAGVTTRTISKSWSDEKDVERCTFELAYPMLEPSSGRDENVYRTLEPANKLLERSFLSGYATPTNNGLYDLDNVAGTYIKDCREDVAEEDFSYSEELGYTVHLQQGGILSLTKDFYSYTGGAHGMFNIEGLTLTVPQGRQLMLKDVVPEEQKDALRKKVTERLLSEWGDALFDEVKDQLTKEAITLEENFYLTSEGMVFYWNSYELAPYVAGTLTVAVPYSEIEGLLISTQ